MLVFCRLEKTDSSNNRPEHIPAGMYRKSKSLSCVWLFGTPWTVAHQAPLIVGFFQAHAGKSPMAQQ